MFNRPGVAFKLLYTDEKYHRFFVHGHYRVDYNKKRAGTATLRVFIKHLSLYERRRFHFYKTARLIYKIRRTVFFYKQGRQGH